MDVMDLIPRIATELALAPGGVTAVVRLLSEGATVPFIARYRKEATGGLDEVQIRAIEEQHTYLTELEARRETVLAEIQGQGKLTPELALAIGACGTKAELEDLYLPFRPKRRTRATIARERGLEPLAELLWTQPVDSTPATSAVAFVNPEKDVPDAGAALSGARDIVAERLSEDAETRKRLRQAFLRDGIVRVAKKKDHKDEKTKFDMYERHEEPLRAIPSHRYLAIRRGEAEGILRVGLELDPAPHRPFLESRVPVRKGSPWASELGIAIDDALERLLLPSVATDAASELKLEADRAAIEIFAKNLRELLLSAPFGSKAVLGIDPGQRTGCKCAVVDETGKLLEHTTVYLVQGETALRQARETLRGLCRQYPVRAIAVGNGTHGRETEGFVREVLAAEGLQSTPFCVSVNESGASVYSASDIAREEFPELDLTVRGAVSIARRLQDPLAELVKIDPKSIGVGQYQHDVSQPLLAKKLDEVVESCVNAVGVDVNTASAPLLGRVAGIGPSLAKKIVHHRDGKGPFQTRQDLRAVSGMGPRTFEQAAGFLRIPSGAEPLDASAVHPERYPLVERMAKDLGCPVKALIGNAALVQKIAPKKYESGDVGAFTLTDILQELQKPGRDPRASFEPPRFRADVTSLEGLAVGMELEGVVTNVTGFGAFVDVGVHQDGLVHVSQLADRYVKDPADVVKVGDKLQVRVLEVDLDRRRIALTAKKGASTERDRGTQKDQKARKGPATQSKPSKPGFSHNPFESHFKK
jgi:protein Tex